MTVDAIAAFLAGLGVAALGFALALAFHALAVARRVRASNVRAAHELDSWFHDAAELADRPRESSNG